MSQDPNLIPAGADAKYQRVAALADGVTIANKAKEEPLAITNVFKYYHCATQSASMHRKDGKKIPFVFGICETNVLADQNYLEEEILNNNMAIRHATEQEIREYKMRKNPQATIYSEVKTDVQAELIKALQEKGVNIPEDVLKSVMTTEENTTTTVVDTNVQNSVDSNLSRLQQIKQRIQGGILTPVSTADINAGAAGSGQ